MTELVCKLKTVLCPVSILSRQTDCNPAARHVFKIDLRMIGSVIHIDSGELSMWAIPPKFTCRGLYHRMYISRASFPKSSSAYSDIERLPGPSGAIVTCSHRLHGRQVKQPEDYALNHP